MGSHQTPFENRHAQALRAGEVGGCTRPKHQGSVGRVAALFSASPGTQRRLSPGLGGWDQAPWLRRRGSPSLFQALLSGAADLVSLDSP